MISNGMCYPIYSLDFLGFLLRIAASRGTTPRQACARLIRATNLKHWFRARVSKTLRLNECRLFVLVLRFGSDAEVVAAVGACPDGRRGPPIFNFAELPALAERRYNRGTRDMEGNLD